MGNRRFKFKVLVSSILIAACGLISTNFYAQGYKRGIGKVGDPGPLKSTRWGGFVSFTLPTSPPHTNLLNSPAASQGRQDTKTIIEQGRRVFSGSCGMAYCHGNDAVGGGGPKLRDREFSAQYLNKVINDGVPGTGMPAFKSNLKKEQIAQVIVFLLSINKEVKSNQAQAQGQGQVNPHVASAAGTPEETQNATKPAETLKPTAKVGDISGLSGDVVAGELLFFDSSQTQNCRTCHTLHGRGGKVASDLSRLSDRTPREILLRILSPQASPDGKYQSLVVTLKTGEQYSGITRDENQSALRIYDTSSLPPVSRNFLKSEIAKTEKLTTSGCPGNYASKFTLKQLLDLVAFLKTTDPAKPVVVSLQELF